MVADMEVDKVADKVADMVADMEIEKVADKAVDIVANLVRELGLNGIVGW